MQVLARIPALTKDLDVAASPGAVPAPSPPVAPLPPAPHRRRAEARQAPSRSLIPDWSIAALAAVALAVWSLVAWRDATGDGRPDRVAVESPMPPTPATARTR